MSAAGASSGGGLSQEKRLLSISHPLFSLGQQQGAANSSSPLKASSSSPAAAEVGSLSPGRKVLLSVGKPFRILRRKLSCLGTTDDDAVKGEIDPMEMQSKAGGTQEDARMREQDDGNDGKSKKNKLPLPTPAASAMAPIARIDP